MNQDATYTKNLQREEGNSGYTYINTMGTDRDHRGVATEEGTFHVVGSMQQERADFMSKDQDP